jgi:iron-sulfur cluster assembly accessory protein
LPESKSFIDGCHDWTTLGALGAALLAHGPFSPRAPVLPPAFPASPIRDDRRCDPCLAMSTKIWHGSCRKLLRSVRSTHRRGREARRRIRAATTSLEERTEMMETQPTVVSLTDAAATKLRELTAEETNPQIGLRVYVYSGGCSGFRYGMMLEDAPTAEDQILKANGVTVYVDGNSVDLLKGSSIDYVDTLMGAGFTVNNPNAVAACGCGSSFRTADDSGQARACAH